MVPRLGKEKTSEQTGFQLYLQQRLWLPENKKEVTR